jgi:hypothetical protein
MALKVDFKVLGNNWNPNMHITHQSIPANCEIWGLKILDWDKSFKKRLKQYSVADLKIPFQYLESIPAWEKGADWKDVGEIMGRFETPAIYSASNAQELTLTMLYHAEALKNQESTKTHWTLENIEIYIKRLQSLMFPQYDGRYSPPTKVLLNIGNIFRNVPLIIKNVSVESTGPYDTLTGLPKMREITLAARVSYPMYQSIGQLQVYTAYDENTDENKYGNEVFAMEVLDNKWQPGSTTSNPYSSAFVNY